MILGHGDDSVGRDRTGLSLVFDVKPMCDRIVLLGSSRRSSTPVSRPEIEENEPAWSLQACVRRRVLKNKKKGIRVCFSKIERHARLCHYSNAVASAT